MFVERIEIPSFRVLRDVVLEFGGGYDPQVFPLGSENGGGKSTMLQLIFVLLHCSAEPERLVYLQNLLTSDSCGSSGEEKVIARLTIRVGEELHALEFVSLDDRFLVGNLKDPPRWGFSTGAVGESYQGMVTEAEERLARFQAAAEYSSRMANDSEIGAADLGEISRLLRLPRGQFPQAPQELGRTLGKWVKGVQGEILVLKGQVESLNADWQRIQALLVARNYDYLTTYHCRMPTDSQRRALVCRADGLSAPETEELLSVVSSKVFLLGPSNQQYLFLGKDARKALLRTKQRPGQSKSTPERETAKPRPQIEYLTSLDEAENAMNGFFAYDWLSVEPLVRLFLSARDEDFQNVVKSGQYGDRYTTLLREVNGLLFGKKVRPMLDDSGKVSGIEFIIVDENGSETPLSPEDLSQGELKRLMIYAWLRANSAIDALVLIDEIEASFHPDWQVGIVRDLQDWGPKNQYILATHSYELCQALTPRHVRELQPRLRRGEGPGPGEAAAPEVKDAGPPHG